MNECMNIEAIAIDKKSWFGEWLCDCDAFHLQFASLLISPVSSNARQPVLLQNSHFVCLCQVHVQVEMFVWKNERKTMSSATNGDDQFWFSKTGDETAFYLFILSFCLLSSFFLFAFLIPFYYIYFISFFPFFFFQ